MKIKYVARDRIDVCIFSEYLKEGNIDDIEIIGTYELCDPIEDIPHGEDHAVQAREKAMAYYQKTGGPIIAYGYAQYFDGVPGELQPGTEQHKIEGKEVSDDEWLDYCHELAMKYGESCPDDDIWSYSIIRRSAHAICLIDENGRVFEAAESRDNLKNASVLFFAEHRKGKKWVYYMDKYGKHYFDYSDEYIGKEAHGKIYTDLLKKVLSEMEKTK